MNTKKTYEIIEINPGSCGLGDMLFMMIDAQKRDDVMFKIPAKAYRLASLYMSTIPIMLDLSKESGYLPDQILPDVRLKQEEIAKARKFLAPYKNPVALCVNCAPYWAYLRETDAHKWETIVAVLSPRFTFVQFGVSEHFTPIKGAVHFLDQDIRHVAACYQVAGRYVGVETGNSHLMLGVRGECWIAEPPPCKERDHVFMHYKHPKCHYYLFENMGQIVKDIR